MGFTVITHNLVSRCFGFGNRQISSFVRITDHMKEVGNLMLLEMKDTYMLKQCVPFSCSNVGGWYFFWFGLLQVANGLTTCVFVD